MTAMAFLLSPLLLRLFVPSTCHPLPSRLPLLWYQGHPDHMDKQLKGSRSYNSSSCSLKILLPKQRWQEKVYPRVCAKMSESDLPGYWGLHLCLSTGGGHVPWFLQKPGLEAELGVKCGAQKSLEPRLGTGHRSLHRSA